MSAAKEKEKQAKKKEKEATRAAAPLKMPKPDKNAPPSRADRAALVAARINKAFNGKGAILSADQTVNTFTIRRPTGIIELDLAIGGGFPAGGLSQLIGEDNSGKSYLANRTISMTQQTYGEDTAIGLCMTETKYDKAFAKWKCGIHIAMSDFEIALLDQARAQHGLAPYNDQERAWLKYQVGTFHEAAFQTAEQVLEAAVQMVEENIYQVVLVDSFGALLTAAEAESDEGLEGRHYGGASGVLTQFMHRLHAALNLPDKYGRPNTTTVLGINQYRENLKATGKYDNPLQIAGGRALKHGKLVDVLLRKGSKIKIGTRSKAQVIVGKEICVERCIKGKAGCHDGGAKGEYRFYYGEYGYRIRGRRVPQPPAVRRAAWASCEQRWRRLVRVRQSPPSARGRTGPLQGFSQQPAVGGGSAAGSSSQKAGLSFVYEGGTSDGRPHVEAAERGSAGRQETADGRGPGWAHSSPPPGPCRGPRATCVSMGVARAERRSTRPRTPSR
jgi:RecA/RadA recombinase